MPAVGALGGFTTYSGTCLDTVTLARERRPITSIFVLVTTLVGGTFLALWHARESAWLLFPVLALLWMALGFRAREAPDGRVEPVGPSSPPLRSPLRSPLRHVVLAAIGGVLGGAIRVAAEPFLAALGVAHAERWSMLGANLAGAALIGVVVARAAGDRAGAFWRTGFCGGLTTVSALAAASAGSAIAGDRPVAFFLLIVTLVVGPSLTLATEVAARRA